jgi:hypothetical protein
MRCGLVAQAPVHGAAEDAAAAGGDAAAAGDAVAGVAGESSGRASAATTAMSGPTARRPGRFREVTGRPGDLSSVNIDVWSMRWMLLDDALKRNQGSTSQ